MKLLLIIIRDEDALDIIEALVHDGFMVTRISSTGGFLRQGNTTLLSGIEEDRLEKALSIIKSLKKVVYVNFPVDTGISAELITTHPIDVASRAIIFILDVERFEKF